MSSYKVNISELKTFENIIKSVDSFGIGFIAVVDDENKLLGIVTDGDIRKALLAQRKEVKEIINTKPLTLLYTTPKSQIISFLENKRRYHMPLVDENNFLKEVFLLNDFDKQYKPNKVIIMAGGLGSRLGELTQRIPKPMLEVKGKPIISYIIESFKSQGFNKFILCVNYKKEIIEEYFNKGENIGVSIEYITEEKRLGTAGALSLIDPGTLQDPFFVVNGDVISNLDYQVVLDFYTINKADALMCAKEMSQTNPYAEVVLDENHNLISLKEKPKTHFNINLGIYMLNKEILNLLPKNEFFDMPNLFLKAKENDSSVKVFLANEDWIDIGKPKDYLSLKNE